MNAGRLAVLLAAVLLTGCEGLKRLENGPDQPPPAPPPADYTVTGTTVGNFDVVPVRVAGSRLTVRVYRSVSPEAGDHECDRFEFWSGANSIRFGYLNLMVGGVTFPVAPAGTRYEIRSVLNP